MPECKWCISFAAKVVWPKPGHPDTKFSCSNPKGLKDPSPMDTCPFWELDELLEEEQEEAAKDILDEQEALRKGQA